MRVLGIISEYNPFHNGHKYHINKSIEKTKADFLIVLMSSSFVQRGEPAIIDKWSRAKTAVLNGADLVIEFPFIYSVQTAEIFAYHAVRILDSLNIVDYISFGTEEKKLSNLKKISKILTNEPKFYKDNLNKFLKLGYSYPVSRAKSLNYYYRNSQVILNNSNNILAIEYLKALNKLESKIAPINIHRKANNYKDIKLNSSGLSSATSIRNNLLDNHKTNNTNVQKSVPSSSIKTLYKFKNTLNYYNSFDNYINYINFALINNPTSLYELFDIDNNLANRISNKRKYFKSETDLLKTYNSKIHTNSKIRRSCLYLLSNFTKEFYINYSNKNIDYIRILASNEKGFKLINKIKNNSNIEVISNFSQIKSIKKDNIKNILEFERKITNLYFLPYNNSDFYNLDFKMSPIIIK